MKSAWDSTSDWFFKTGPIACCLSWLGTTTKCKSFCAAFESGHRGGPAGFLRVLGPHQLGFADFDWNCPQYITPRFTEAEVEQAVAPLKVRIAELEAQLRRSTTVTPTLAKSPGCGTVAS